MSVVVPARDADRHLDVLLRALASQDGVGESEVIVVDNGSLDGTAARAEQAEEVTTVVRRERGEGPGAARNAGARVAAGDVVAFLDADCRPAPGWLRAGVAAMDGADLVQGRVVPDPDSQPGPFDRTLGVNEAHGLFESANLFVRRELFERLGGFPVGLEHAGATGLAGHPFGEDVVFGWQARRAGARTAFCPGALAYHAVIPRGALEYVRERGRLRHFPELAREVPELREAFFYRRYFHTRRSAEFDLALAGLALALATRRAAPMVAAVPYVRLAGRDARRWGRRRAGPVAAVEMAADGVGALALWWGSLRARTVVL